MLLTEKEAKKKECPQIAPVNVHDHWVKCRASECMAWRWAVVKNHMEERPQNERFGYCGLAGKPE
jgi:hypothetical protein